MAISQVLARRRSFLYIGHLRVLTVLSDGVHRVLVSSIDYGSLSAGEASAIQMTINLSFVDMTTT